MKKRYIVLCLYGLILSILASCVCPESHCNDCSKNEAKNYRNHATDMNKIHVGISKSDVIKILGHPDSIVTREQARREAERRGVSGGIPCDEIFTYLVTSGDQDISYHIWITDNIVDAVNASDP